MNFEKLIKLSKLLVPGGKSSRINNDDRATLLNHAKDVVCTDLKCLPVNETFGVVAEQQTYNLSANLTRYICPDAPGLWWYNGSNWKRLYPRTLEWLDENQGNWRDADSGDPRYYSIDGDEITVFPKPDTTLSDGFKMYFFQSSADMNVDGDYPFGGNAEISRLKKASELILFKFQELAGDIIGQEDISNKGITKYDNRIEQVKGDLNYRPDAIADEDNIMEIDEEVC